MNHDVRIRLNLRTNLLDRHRKILYCAIRKISHIQGVSQLDILSNELTIYHVSNLWISPVGWLIPTQNGHARRVGAWVTLSTGRALKLVTKLTSVHMVRLRTAPKQRDEENRPTETHCDDEFRERGHYNTTVAGLDNPVLSHFDRTPHVKFTGASGTRMDVSSQ